jgi:MinD superfamily P-loop ATPase
MKQLLILSGKGGTGKTTIASAFISLSKARAYADCDVDAPNLHLITEWKSAPESSDFLGLPKAEIDKDICIGCGICRRHCRFDAIKPDPEYEIDLYACEGCGVCEYVCPAGAVKMVPHVAGELMLYTDDEKVFSTAQLKMGSGTSGLLVSEVKKRMKSAAREDVGFAIIDGSPGIGCPVIASLSGVDMVLIVAEPSLSGISDMERIIDTAKKFGVKIAVCVNKYDTNLKNTEKIESFCRENNFPYLGRIPFDTEAVKAVNSGKTIADIDCESGRAVKEVYRNTIEMLSKI